MAPEAELDEIIGGQGSDFFVVKIGIFRDFEGDLMTIYPIY